MSAVFLVPLLPACSHFIGLSGLQALGADGQPLPLAASQVAADPPDLNVFPGHSGETGMCREAGGPLAQLQQLTITHSLTAAPAAAGDCRTVDKLVDGVANTMDDTHM